MPASSADSPALSRSWLGRCADAWDRFWFSAADPTPLGLMRVCCGLMALYVHLIYTGHLHDLFGAQGWLDLRAANEMRTDAPTPAPRGDWEEPAPAYVGDLDPQARQRIWAYHDRWGVDPRQVAGRGHFVWSIWFHVTDPTWMAVVHGLYLTVLVLFLIGYQTRVTAGLAWIGALSYIHRAPMTLFGMDTVLIITLMYLTIGPSGAALSLDRWLARYRAGRRALARGEAPPPRRPPAPQVSANFALRLFQLHLCLIYLSSGLSKIPGGSWWNGTAVWKPLATFEYAPLGVAAYAEALRFVAANRWVFEIVTSAGTALTLFVEIGFPFLVWNRRLRWVMLAAAATMHLAIGLLMGLLTFSLCMITLALSFVPAEVLRRLGLALFAGPARWRLLYDRAAPAQVRAASLVYACDVGAQVAVEEGPADPSGAGRLALLGAAPPPLSGFELFEQLTRSLRTLWFLGAWTWIPGVGWLGRALWPGVGSRQPAAPPAAPTAS